MILNRTAGKFTNKVDSRAVRHTIPDGLRLEASLIRGFRLFVYKAIYGQNDRIKTDYFQDKCSTEVSTMNQHWLDVHEHNGIGMKFIIAKKLEMTQRFRADGTVVPVTLLQVTPCVVTQIKTSDSDGYEAVQLGCGEIRQKLVAKPQQGHMKISGKLSRELSEFRVESAADFKIGDTVEVAQFNPGEFVHVTATSKGCGFQGVVKRHGFKGGPASHGHKDNLRMPGSIGSGGIERVFKGMRMAGRMGTDRVTVKNLEIIDVDTKNGVLAIKGAVPGARGASVLVSGGFDKRQSWN